MYDYCESQTSWPPSLAVNVSDYGTDGRGPGGHIFSVFLSSFFFNFFMLIYFILVIWNDKTFHSFMFFIELCTNSVRWGKFGPPEK